MAEFAVAEDLREYGIKWESPSPREPTLCLHLSFSVEKARTANETDPPVAVNH